MADFTLDGLNKLLIEPAGIDNTSFNVKRDLYSAWKRWAQTSDNSKFLAAFSVEGGTPIGDTGIFTGATFVLVNGWKVQPADYPHQLTLNGNIFSDDGIVAVASPTASTQVFVNASVAAQGVSLNGAVSGGGLTAEQDALLRVIRDHVKATNAQTQDV